MPTKNRQFVLAARPQGLPKESDFQLVETEIRNPGGGEVLLRTLYLSVDPYMRGRDSRRENLRRPVEIGASGVQRNQDDVGEVRRVRGGVALDAGQQREQLRAKEAAGGESQAPDCHRDKNGSLPHDDSADSGGGVAFTPAYECFL